MVLLDDTAVPTIRLMASLVKLEIKRPIPPEPDFLLKVKC